VLDDENNLVVLDPNHELMSRFQKSLKKLLTKREEKLTLEVREAKYELEVSYNELCFELNSYFIFLDFN
jgi:hypothetical protein